ncbi:hypothetical protein [Micromonospora arida]|uniref:hypothetical protein n=1 Tax=Micromonospora arida TaxID=2203715 RepID=UPI0033F81ED2
MIADHDLGLLPAVGRLVQIRLGLHRLWIPPPRCGPQTVDRCVLKFPAHLAQRLVAGGLDRADAQVEQGGHVGLCAVVHVAQDDDGSFPPSQLSQRGQ